MFLLYLLLLFGCAFAFDSEYSQESFASVRSSEFSLTVPSFLHQSNIFRRLKGPTGVTIRLETLLENFMFVYANVSFGTPPQYFSLFPSTEYTDLLVNSKKCEKCGGGYDSNASSTYVADGRPVVVPFEGEKDLKGFLSIDTVCAGRVCAKSQSLVEITGEKGYKLPKYTDGALIGALGLGRQSQASFNTSSFLKTLVDEKFIPKQMFAYWLNRTESLHTKGYVVNGGELHLGEIKYDKFVGPINWVPTTSNKSWEIRVEQIRYGGGGVACENGCNALLDIGHPLIMGPTKEIDAIYKLIGTTSGMISCEKVTTLPEITFVLGESNLTLKGIDYTYELVGACFLYFEHNKDDVWILGQPLLGSYYSIFDDEEGRYGFAKLKSSKHIADITWSWPKTVIAVVLLLASLSAVVTLLWCCLYKCFCAPDSRYIYRDFS